MKKAVALFLAAALVLSFGACGRKKTPDTMPDIAEEQTREDAGNDFVPPPAEEDGTTGARLFTPYANVISKGAYYLKYHVQGEAEASEFALKGGNIAVKKSDMTQVVEGDTIYNIMHAQKFILTAKVGDAMRNNLTVIGIKSADEAREKFLESAREEIDGKTYTYERFSTGENSYSQFYFDGNVLKYIKNFTDGSEKQMIEVLEFSEKVPSELFNIPSNYVKQEI